MAATKCELFAGLPRNSAKFFAITLCRWGTFATERDRGLIERPGKSANTAKAAGMSGLSRLHGTEILRGGQADVANTRERSRLQRIRRLNLLLWGVAAWMALRLMWNEPLLPGL